MESKTLGSKLPDKQALSWAFYEFANTGYAMVVIALIFPDLYKNFYAAGLSSSHQTAWFTGGLAVASLMVAVLAPALGAVAQVGNIRKRLLLRFAVAGMLCAASLYFVPENQYWLATILYIFGTVCFYCANIFFDSLLAKVARTDNVHFISGFGFSLSYIAGFLLLVIILLVTVNAEALGFANTIDASRSLFLLAAVWWAVFTLPIALVLNETPNSGKRSIAQYVTEGFGWAKSTLVEIFQTRHIFWFLLAYLFYIDGLNTVIMTAANYGSTIGFSQEKIRTAFFIVQVVAVPCALLFGLAGQKFGPRRMLFVAIAIYTLVTAYAATMSSDGRAFFGLNVSEMYLLAFMVGLVQGGTQALSRSYFTSIVPPEKNASFFGFYSMIGKSAAILGPAMMGTVALFFNDPDRPDYSTRIGFASLALLFIIGGLFLLKAKPVEELR